MTKVVALESQDTTELEGVAVAVSCTGPPRVVTAGLEGVRLVEPKHALAMQSWPTPQTVPQPPQLLTSAVVSTHDVEHSVGVGAGQVQTPARQAWASEGQALPHVPQFWVSAARSTQAAPQRSGVGGGQVQVPAVQDCAAAGQGFVQLPQAVVSVWRNLQPWAQIVLPVGHAEVWLFVLSSWSDTGK